LLSVVRHPPIRSFAAADYRGLHAYYLIDAQRRRQAFRYHWASTMRGERVLTKAEAARCPSQFLIAEMRERVAREPVQWELIFTLAEPGDRTNDQLRGWPASRRKIRAGMLTLVGEHQDQDHVERMVFDPTNVPPGIECSGDPLLAFRSAVYRASHAARTIERGGAQSV
jgi:catalase